MDVDNLIGTSGTTAEQRIQAAYGTTTRAQRFYDTQMLDHLNGEMIAFLGQQEMMFVATADAAGRCDNTFRAGPPGFVTVLNDGLVAWPEYRGNGVHASLANITENANAALLFVDFFQHAIGLHVNGRAAILEDADFRQRHPQVAVDETRGRRTERWVLVEVEEAYIHCRKHIPHLAKREGTRQWGSDDARSKGGDFFHVARDHTPTEVASGSHSTDAPETVNGLRSHMSWHRRLTGPFLRRFP